jgi:hypothetical protein
MKLIISFKSLLVIRQTAESGQTEIPFGGFMPLDGSVKQF